MLIAYICEDSAIGSVSATDIGGIRGNLFGNSAVKRISPSAGRNNIPVIKFKNHWTAMFSNYIKRRISEAASDKKDSDAAAVVAKLQANLKRAKRQSDTSTSMFGLVDENNQTVKITVAREEAVDFEKALSHALNDDGMSNQDIAELVYELNSKFTIIDVEWPNVEEDEEEPTKGPLEQAGAAEQDPSKAPADQTTDAAPEDSAGELDDLASGDEPPEDNSTDAALKEIIGMLKANAEAQKAEAQAKSAEARAREAEAAADLAKTKMTGEEEILDAESYFRGQKSQRREADRLRMLARYRQETSQSDEADGFEFPEKEAGSTAGLGQVVSNNKGYQDEEIKVSKKRLLAFLRDRQAD